MKRRLSDVDLKDPSNKFYFYGLKVGFYRFSLRILPRTLDIKLIRGLLKNPLSFKKPSTVKSQFHDSSSSRDGSLILSTSYIIITYVTRSPESPLTTLPFLVTFTSTFTFDWRYFYLQIHPHPGLPELKKYH